LKMTLSYSWASAVQQTFVYMGRLLVQSTINPFGASVIAAYNGATRVEALFFAVFESVATSYSTYCAQNVGAGRRDRLKEGFVVSEGFGICFWLVTAVAFVLFSPQIMSIFISGEGKAEVMRIGAEYLRPASVFYILVATTGMFQALFRGVGRLTIVMIASALQIIIRISLVGGMVDRFGVAGAAYSQSIGWTVMLIYEIVFFIYFWRKGNLIPKTAHEKLEESGDIGREPAES